MPAPPKMVAEHREEVRTMSQFENIISQVRAQWDQVQRQVQARLFGANNERLDLVMDTFNRLNQQQRTMALTGIGAGIFLLIAMAVGLYLGGVHSLQQDLEESFAALQEFDTRKKDFQAEDAKYSQLIEMMSKQNTVAKKPLLEKVSKDVGVELEGLSESKVALPNDNPLSKKVQEAKLDMRLSNISIPKLLNFLVEVEKSSNLLRVRDLTVRGRYGTRLYFDSQIVVRGYTAGE